MKNFALPLLLTLATLSGAHAQVPKPTDQVELRPIEALDVPRYMGTWFEIAKFPNWFQKKCTAGGTRAEYALLGEGAVRVVNRCRTDGGVMTEAVGQARQVGGSSSPKLQVRFAPPWLSFVPFVWGNYWVVDLDPDYQLAAVSEPKREYLWVLSRTPHVDAGRYQALMERLRQKGFDTSKLEITPQD